MVLYKHEATRQLQSPRLITHKKLAAFVEEAMQYIETDFLLAGSLVKC
jgi:hypothetical protein